MPREFEIRREVVLPATPDEIFQAVSTRAGNAAWLFPYEAGEGARIDSEPPHRFAVREERGDWFNALEFVIERDGATSVMRYAHSGIFVEDWDSQYDGASAHTDFYLHTPGQYLRYFGGRTATYIGTPSAGIVGPAASAAAGGFVRLQRALGVAAEASEDDAITLTPAGLAPIEGVIDYVHPHFLGVRSLNALYRFFGRNAFGAPVAMSVHDFAEGVDAEHERRRWERWLHTTLA